MMNQPTAKEIFTALKIAREIGTPEAARDLRRIRDRKTTWIGVVENRLRTIIDRYLSVNMRPNGGLNTKARRIDHATQER